MTFDIVQLAVAVFALMPGFIITGVYRACSAERYDSDIAYVATSLSYMASRSILC